MNWYFMRHGQINSNLNHVYSGRSDEALNSCGLAQAHEAAEQLGSVQIDHIICSPLVRTTQTANIIAIANNLHYQTDNAFIEMAFGPWEGKSEFWIKQHYPIEWALWNRAPHQLQLPRRETLLELQNRVLRRMHKIAAKEPEKTVLVITHVSIIRVVLLQAQNRPLSDYKTVAVDNCELFPVTLQSQPYWEPCL
ncbi:histidine phosphatase family protein [SAR92 clade bacterium H231]|jgi:probable phosphoglycerate mutase|nr:histidine phosphatase family protein [SAR92 clade bacterium H231]